MKLRDLSPYYLANLNKKKTGFTEQSKGKRPVLKFNTGSSLPLLHLSFLKMS